MKAFGHKVHQIDRDVLQENLMERNGGRAMEDLEGLPHSLMAPLCGTLQPALIGWKDLTEKSQSGEFEAPTKTHNHQKRTPNLTQI
jgi:hypothetical protein